MWWYTTKEDRENTWNEIKLTAETALNKFESGDYLGGFGEAIKIPILSLGLIPNDPSMDFIMPLGMVKQTPRLLNLGSKFIFSRHAIEKMEERFITKTMVKLTLEEGAIYTGHSSGALSIIAKDCFSSGKSLLVGLNPKTKVVTTVIPGKFDKLVKNLNEKTTEIFKTLK